jgi:hypothetical protein
MAFLGLRGTGDWATDERPKNFREMILFAQPNGRAPLTALLARMGSESVNDPEFNWWEETLSIARVQVSGVINTTTVTSIVVTSGAYQFVPGEMLLIETSDATTAEIVRVNNVTSDTAFDVIRAQAGTSAAAIPDSTYITRIGSSYSEGSTSPSVSSRNPTKKTNYCQIFKTAYEVTNTAKMTKVRTGDVLKNEKKRRMFDHASNMELAFMFGKPFETTGTNGKPMRYTGGLRHFITSNVTVFATTPTETTFINAVSPVFNYDAGGGSERLVLCGNGFLNSLNRLAKAGMQVRTDNVVKLYGMELTKWILPQGTFLLKSHPLMNVHSGRYTYSAFILDPGALRYRYMRDTSMQDNIQSPDADEIKGQWLTEAGLEIRHEKTCAYVGNFVY